MAEVKRASDDFKRTWEDEVELERRKPALDAAGGPRPAGGEAQQQPAANTGASAWGATASGVTAEELMSRAVQAQDEGRTVARNAAGAETWAGVGANEDGGGAAGAGGAGTGGEQVHRFVTRGRSACPLARRATCAVAPAAFVCSCRGLRTSSFPDGFNPS